MIVNAVMTNAVTNALHASFLFIYFIGACMHRYRHDDKFSLPITLFFLTLLVLKLLGVYVHYYDVYAILPPAWIAISLITVMLAFLFTEGMEMPELSRIIIVFISILSSFMFLTNQGDFTWIALPILLTYLIVAWYAQALLRVGCLMVVISNILWISVRKFENFTLGHEIAIEYRYDNDMYHLLLIISTFIIYQAIARGALKRA